MNKSKLKNLIKKVIKEQNLGDLAQKQKQDFVKPPPVNPNNMDVPDLMGPGSLMNMQSLGSTWRVVSVEPEGKPFDSSQINNYSFNNCPGGSGGEIGPAPDKLKYRRRLKREKDRRRISKPVQRR